PSPLLSECIGRPHGRDSFPHYAPNGDNLRPPAHEGQTPRGRRTPHGPTRRSSRSADPPMPCEHAFATGPAPTFRADGSTPPSDRAPSRAHPMRSSARAHSPLQQGLAAVDPNLRPGDVTGPGAGQEGDQLGDLLRPARLTVRQRDGALRVLDRRARVLQVPLLGVVVDLRLEGAGTDDVDAHAVPG